MMFQTAKPSELADMHFDELVKGFSSEATPAECYAVYDKAENILAFSRLSESPWHTAMLGVPLYRTQPFLYRMTRPRSLLSLITTLASVHPKGVVEVKVDGSDRQAGSVLAGSGFKLVGISVKLSARQEDLSLPEVHDPDVRVRRAAERDVERAKALVRKTHVVSHFFNQPLFPPGKVREMFAAWFEKCFEGLADAVLVAERKGKIVGFITLFVNKKMVEVTGTPVGVVDFVGVNPSTQRKGIGTALLLEGHRILEKQCGLFEIRTELDNYPAIRAYQRFGYRITSSDQVWHKAL